MSPTLLGFSDNDLLAVANDFDVAGPIEENHRAWMFVNGRFMRHFLDVDIEDSSLREIYGFGMHEIAFEEHFYPAAVLGDSENNPGGISDDFDRLVRRSGFTHELSRTSTSRTGLPD